MNIATANQIVRRIKRNFLFFRNRYADQNKKKLERNDLHRSINELEKVLYIYQFPVFLQNLIDHSIDPLGQNPTFSEQKAKTPMASKREWDQTMAKSGIFAKTRQIKKRTSGRKGQLSKALHHVDADTRAHVTSQRLAAYENDSTQAAAQLDEDDMYNDKDEGSNVNKKISNKRKKKRNGDGGSTVYPVRALKDFVFEEV